jgi:hypothetical protein
LRFPNGKNFKTLTTHASRSNNTTHLNVTHPNILIDCCARKNVVCSRFFRSYLQILQAASTKGRL